MEPYTKTALRLRQIIQGAGVCAGKPAGKGISPEEEAALMGAAFFDEPAAIEAQEDEPGEAERKEEPFRP
jgi:hypothetical protein